MSNGLDFSLGDRQGRAIRHTVSVEAAFASVAIGRLIDDGEYPTLAPLWGYHSTTVALDDVASLRADVVTLIKAAQVQRVDQEIIDELDVLFAFLKGAEKLGLGIHADGP
jgi:hypothetical protein